MVNTIDMQEIRYLNLFSKITRVQTRFCLKYNDTLVFCVPKKFVATSVGEGGKNIRKISETFKKKVKVVAQPNGIEDVQSFIEAIVNPTKFKSIEVKDKEILITGGGIQNKAALIGRNKKRLLELQKIIKNFFNKELRII